MDAAIPASRFATGQTLVNDLFARANHRVGSFHEAGMLADAQLELSTVDPRKAERFETQLEAGIRRSGSRTVPAVVIDLSAAGFRVQAEERLPIGTIVWLKLGMLAPQMAKVKWSRGLLAGCRFDVPLSPYILEQFLAAST